MYKVFKILFVAIGLNILFELMHIPSTFENGFIFVIGAFSGAWVFNLGER